MRYRQSNWAGLGPDLDAPSVPDNVYMEIREAMLNELGEYGPVHHFLLDMSIACATDIDELWRLREELVGVLNSRYGERAAQQRMSLISKKFVGFHPEA